MEVIEPKGRPQPFQAEPSSRKRKRLPIVVCQVLLVIMVTKRTSSLVDAATAMIQAKRTWVLLNAHLPDLIEFMFRYAHSLAGLGLKRSRTLPSIAERSNISHVVKQEMVGPPQPQSEPPTVKLQFVGPLKEPIIYTNRKLTHELNRPIEVQLFDTKMNKLCADSSHLKVEIFVMRGDFIPNGQYASTSAEFERNILTSRSQKRPLLVGKKLGEVKEGRAIFSDLMITDISKNFDCQTFKLGAQIVECPNFPRIQEACTEDFRVKDCRGEKDKKHEYPSLDDEVWRLKNIAKGGKFHERLLSFKNSQGDPRPIGTVGDFLKMLNKDPERLKSSLKIKENKWQETVAHARKAVPAPGETSMVNSAKSETEPNTASQVTENTGVLLQLDPQTGSPLDQTMIFPTNNSTFNPGLATNSFNIPGTMFNCLNNYIAELTSQQSSQMYNTFPTFTQGETSSSMFISGETLDLPCLVNNGGNAQGQVDQLEGPSTSSALISNIGGNNAQHVDPLTNLGAGQISVGLLFTAPQEREVTSYAQLNVNHYGIEDSTGNEIEQNPAPQVSPPTIHPQPAQETPENMAVALQRDYRTDLGFDQVNPTNSTFHQGETSNMSFPEVNANHFPPFPSHTDLPPHYPAEEVPLEDMYMPQQVDPLAVLGFDELEDPSNVSTLNGGNNAHQFGGFMTPAPAINGGEGTLEEIEEPQPDNEYNFERSTSQDAMDALVDSFYNY